MDTEQSQAAAAESEKVNGQMEVSASDMDTAAAVETELAPEMKESETADSEVV